MALVMISEIPELTREQYESVVTKVNEASIVRVTPRWWLRPSPWCRTAANRSSSKRRTDSGLSTSAEPSSSKGIEGDQDGRSFHGSPRRLLQADRLHLLSDEHFSVDGTLIEAAASLKTFRRKDEPPPPKRADWGSSNNRWVDFQIVGVTVPKPPPGGRRSLRRKHQRREACQRSPRRTG